MAGHAGDRPTVLAALSSPDPRVRVTALGAAERLEMLDARSLSPFLTDPATEVRARAIEVAARIPDGHRLTRRLLDALDIPELAEVTAFALGELEIDATNRASVIDAANRASVIDALGHQARHHGDALARESAVAALGSLGDGLAHILAATTDVATVRRRAILALAPFEGEAVDRALRLALDDRDWQVRQAAEDLLDPLGSPLDDPPET